MEQRPDSSGYGNEMEMEMDVNSTLNVGAPEDRGHHQVSFDGQADDSSSFQEGAQRVNRSSTTGHIIRKNSNYLPSSNSQDTRSYEASPQPHKRDKFPGINKERLAANFNNSMHIRGTANGAQHHEMHV